MGEVNSVLPYLRRIRELREDNDLSQTQIAKLLNVEQRTYSDYESGRIRIPLDSMMILAKYYDVSMDYMCGLTKERGCYPEK